MSDYNEYDGVEVAEEESFESGKDYSTAIGIAAIAAGGAVAYEGVKQGTKLAKSGFSWLKGKIVKRREAKDNKEAEGGETEAAKSEEAK